MKEKLKIGSPVIILAFKKERELEVFVKNESTGKYGLLRTYPIFAAEHPEIVVKLTVSALKMKADIG